MKIGEGREIGVAATYIALLILLGFTLAVRVIVVRRSQKIGIGDGDDRQLMKRIRCHGNFSEYAPLLIAILILLPLLGAKDWMIHLAGAAAVTGRTLHAIGLSQSSGVSFGRMAGMLLTFTTLVLGALALLWLAWA
ncbi:MAG: MAPEG family protein [Beijerinckiaceae bacterium]|nr:MAPEG family protein [Beijerinckiaceae bacterium]